MAVDYEFCDEDDKLYDDMMAIRMKGLDLILWPRVQSGPGLSGRIKIHH